MLPDRSSQQPYATQELTGQPGSPLSLAGLGIAYRVQNVVEGVDSTSPAAGKLKAAVHAVPVEVENYVAREKLASMGISIDELTVSQKKYMSGWEQGT